MSGFGLACDVMHSTIDDIGLSEISQIAHAATDAAVEHENVALHLQPRIIALADWKYPVLLGSCADQLRENFGHSETLYACNTYQFSDYSRYAMTVFKEEEKRKYRDEHFPLDLKKAYELGKRLVGKCQEG